MVDVKKISIYNLNIGDSMKSKTLAIIQLVMSILLYVLVDGYFFKVLGLFGLHFKGLAYEIANTIKYLLITLVIFVIYYKNIKAGKTKFGKTWINSLIYCVACFVFLILVTIVLHDFLNYIGNPRGISIGYKFTNYFDNRFTLSFALNLVVECIFMPFLLCIIFPLGFSNVIKKSSTASLVSGLTYGIVYGVMLHTSFENAIFYSLTPAILVALLTYLYKTNQNIWSVIVTYICYVLFGIFAINYIV